MPDTAPPTEEERMAAARARSWLSDDEDEECPEPGCACGGTEEHE